MSAVDLSKILSRYKKGWLALSSDNQRLVATGKTLDEVLKRAEKKGVENPSVFKAAPVSRLFAGEDGVSLY